MTTPIRRRLMRMLLLTSGLVTLFSTALFVTYEITTFRQTIIQQLEILGSAISRNSTAALAFQNSDDARGVLEAFRANPHIVGAALYDESGAMFAAYGDDSPARLSAEQAAVRIYRFEGAHAAGYEPVMLDGQRLGTLFVRSDLSAIDDRLWLIVIITAIVIALSALVAWLLATRQQKLISQPIFALAEAARAVSERRDYGVRAPSANMLELDQLTAAFNHMLTQIGAADTRTRAHMNRLSLLQHITSAIGDRQDLPSIFQVVLRNVEENLPVDFGCVCLYDSASHTLTVTTIGAASRTRSAALDLAEGSIVPIDENGLSRCVRGHLVYEPDVRKIPHPFPQRFANGGMYSLVIAPLTVEASVFGVFIAARRRGGGLQQRRLRIPHAAVGARGAGVASGAPARRPAAGVRRPAPVAAHRHAAGAVARARPDGERHRARHQQRDLADRRCTPSRCSSASPILPNAHVPRSTVIQTRHRRRGRDGGAHARVLSPARAGDDARRSWTSIAPSRTSSSSRARNGSTCHSSADSPSTCVMEFTKGLPGIMGAEGEIRDALTNLIFNAVDAMPEGGAITVRTALPADEQRHAAGDRRGLGHRHRNGRGDAAPLSRAVLHHEG